MDFSPVHRFQIVQNGSSGRDGARVVSNVGVGERKERESVRSKINAGHKGGRN
jgi:hypothetical protein